MLYLNPPYLVIEGVCVFSDHEDLLQFYYLPMMPKLTQIPDPATGEKVPQIQVIKYRGAAGNGGFLNFDCNIGVDKDKLDDIAQEIKSSMRLRETPRLGPVPLIDGTVRLLLFGAGSPDPTPPRSGTTGTTTPSSTTSTTVTASPTGSPTGPKFVTKIDQAAKPALYGDNQAAFSVALDQSGVTVLEQALKGEMSPIGIVYSLDYLGLRPAYNVSVDVKWDRVQHHLDEKFGTNFLGLFSSEIEKAVDELIESRDIEINVDTFVPEGEEDSGITGRRDKAVEEAREMITNAFFQSSLDPVKEQKDTADTALKVIRGIVTGGIDAKESLFSYKKIDYTRIDKKSLNFNMRERTTVRRTIYPQGHLSGLFRTLRDGGENLDRFVISVDLDDPYFERRRVKTIARTDFAEDSIGSLDVRLSYGNNPKNVILDPTQTSADLEWNSNLVNGAIQREVKVSYKVSFKGVDNMERPGTLQSPEQTTVFDNLEINPRELYGIVHVPIIALSFPFDRYPQVEVQTRYADEDNGIRMDETFLLAKDKPEQEWKIFVRDPQRTKFEYKLIFRAVDNRDIEQTWVETDEEHVFIRDPFPQKRVVDVVTGVPWVLVQDVFVDLSYEDPQNDITQEASLHFNQTDSSPKSFVVELRNPNLRRIAYSVTIMYADGRLVEIPRSFTLERRIFVRADMRGHKIVTIRPQPVSFATNKIKKLTVETRYADAEAGLSSANVANFASADDQSSFEFDYVDPAKARYEYRTNLLFTNGLTKATDWQQTDKDDLIVPIN
jgi:hypothetical protein